MIYLIVGLVIFLGVHSVSIVSYAWRDRMAATSSARDVWRALYSFAALAGLALIVYGYGLARTAPVILYVPPLWMRDTMVMLMVFVFPILFAAYFPGLIRTALKHPMLVAVKLWAVLHCLVNGSLADVVLFGSAARVGGGRSDLAQAPSGARRSERAAVEMERRDRDRARLRRVRGARRRRARVAHGDADRVHALSSGRGHK